MKRLFILIFIVFATSTVWAKGDNPNVEISPFGGLATTGSDVDALGWGMGLFLGLPIGDQFSLGEQTAYYSIVFQPPNPGPDQTVFSLGGGKTILNESLLCKKRFGNDPLHFVIEAGGGLSFYSDNSREKGISFGLPYSFDNHISETCPMALGGIGLEASLSQGLAVYCIVGMDIIFLSGDTEEYIPIAAGLSILP